MVISNILKEAFMPFGFPSRRYGVLLGTVCACVAILFVFASQTFAEPASPQLVVTVGDTVGPAGQANSVITVYLDNYVDSIAAFTLWLRLDRPDICLFKTDTQTVVDTTYWRCLAYQNSKCVDSESVDKSLYPGTNIFRRISSKLVQVGSINKTGSLIQNWDLVTTRSIAGNGTDLLINGIANTFQPPDPANPPPLGPGSGSLRPPLFRLLADILPISDTMTDRTVNIIVEHAFLDKFIFSRPNGTAIGVYGRIVPDTVCYRCLAWVGGKCVDTQKVSSPPCDWTAIIPDTIPTLDTSKVHIFSGRLTATSCCVGTTGNVNNVGIVDISDLSLLVAYLTASPRPTLPCTKEANVNALGIVDISDLSLLVAYLTVLPRPTLPNCP